MDMDQGYAKKSGRETTPRKDLKAINFMVRAQTLLGLLPADYDLLSSSLVSGWITAYQRDTANRRIQVRRLPKQKGLTHVLLYADTIS
jgi:YD repeat-containing protein